MEKELLSILYVIPNIDKSIEVNFIKCLTNFIGRKLQI